MSRAPFVRVYGTQEKPVILTSTPGGYRVSYFTKDNKTKFKEFSKKDEAQMFARKK